MAAKLFCTPKLYLCSSPASLFIKSDGIRTHPNPFLLWPLDRSPQSDEGCVRNITVYWKTEHKKMEQTWEKLNTQRGEKHERKQTIMITRFGSLARRTRPIWTILFFALLTGFRYLGLSSARQFFGDCHIVNGPYDSTGVSAEAVWEPAWCWWRPIDGCEAMGSREARSIWGS